MAIGTDPNYLAAAKQRELERIVEAIFDEFRGATENATYLDRPIEGDWPYVWMDATCIKVRRAGYSASVAVIIAVGVNRTDGGKFSAWRSGRGCVD